MTSIVSALVRVLLGGLLGLLLVTTGTRDSNAQTLPSVTGTVVEAETQKLLAGADVRLRRSDGDRIVRSTATDQIGTFRFAGVRPGQYVLEVHRLGYETYQRPLLLELGASRVLDIALSIDPASVETIVLSPSRRAERILDVPASVSVLDAETIRKEGGTSAVEALSPTVGVDVAQTGVRRHILALRGVGDLRSLGCPRSS